jgi:hypothetical protein
LGYRELLKKYLRIVELRVGHNFIEEIEPGPELALTQRDIAELRKLAREIQRCAQSEGVTSTPNDE